MNLTYRFGIIVFLIFGISRSGPAQAISVTNSGVGIGTPSPLRLLHAANAGGAELILEGTNGLANYKKWNFYVGGASGDKKHLFLRLLNDAGNAATTNAMLWTADGNVGIGSNSPQGKLSVSINGDSLSIYSPASNTLAIQTLLDNQPLVGYNGYGGDFENRLLLQPLAGNVGIGTSNPTHRLTVNGQVKSKGFITDTSSWADYVFKNDYKLPALKDVEQHIKEKGHLPDIPSEQEVMEKGVNLGEMQIKLLAQIEQLTLHVIAQEKRLVAQENRIKELETTIQK